MAAFCKADLGYAAHNGQKPNATPEYLSRFFEELKWTTVQEAERQTSHMIETHTFQKQPIAFGIAPATKVFTLTVGDDVYSSPLFTPGAEHRAETSWRKALIQPLVHPLGPVPANQDWLDQCTRESRLAGSAGGPLESGMHPRSG